MNFWEAIILGIVQGATEFLPISSSAHLVLVPDILNMPELGLTMVGVVHAGTLLAVLFYPPSSPNLSKYTAVTHNAFLINATTSLRPCSNRP